MAIIYVYPLKAIPSAEDLIVITDSTSTNPQEATKNISITSLFSNFDTNTTYDLTSVQNASDSDIKLTGSDATVDIVKLVAGTNISLVDSGSNITINSTGGGGSGTVTSVGTSNAMGANSGITFLAAPNPIVGAGTIDLSFAGTIGDILYADTATSLKLLPAAASGYVLESNGVGVAPSWKSKEIIIEDEGIVKEAATTVIDFTGIGVTVTSPGPAGEVKVNIPGGGSVDEAQGAFTPILVTQGLNGSGTLQDLNGLIAGFTYLSQYGSYYILNKHIYIDFYINFKMGAESAAIQNTLGVSAFDVTGTTPASNVLGLQGINVLAAQLKIDTKNNAGVDITDVESNAGTDPSIIGWDHAPQGGKLNKYYGEGTTSNKSVAWFHWLAQPVLAGEIRTEYNVTVGTWANMDGEKEFVIAGSLNPIAFGE